jgi:hypothetical protein
MIVLDIIIGENARRPFQRSRAESETFLDTSRQVWQRLQLHVGGGLRRSTLPEFRELLLEKLSLIVIQR